ncbi:MAG: hypothetical protein EXR77_04100 [Myxococcales bacterium]|nr:hypothetical protein [Myxococcales bacterium]
MKLAAKSAVGLAMLAAVLNATGCGTDAAGTPMDAAVAAADSVVAADSETTAETGPAADAAASSPDGALGAPPTGLTVAQWATFTVFHATVPAQHIAGVGRQEESLPAFVHRRPLVTKGAVGEQLPQPPLANVQTAGAFFGAATAGDFSYAVTLPQAVVTADWPPADSNLPAVGALTGLQAGKAQWALHVDPKATAEVPPAAAGSLWAGLRSNGGARVHRIGDPTAGDHQLFYRALGSFSPQLRISAKKSQFSGGYDGIVHNDGPAIAAAWLLHLHSGGGLLQRLYALPANADSPFSRTPKESPQAYFAMVKTEFAAELQQQGLTVAQSQALVATFTHNWLKTFGLRVIVVAPTAWADSWWQTQVEPKPVSAVRVLLGRFELLTAEGEAELLQQMAAAAPKMDIAVVDTLGFFAEPKARRAAQGAASAEMKDFANKVLAAAEQLP